MSKDHKGLSETKKTMLYALQTRSKFVYTYFKFAEFELDILTHDLVGLI
jgi:hypothetical protein